MIELLTMVDLGFARYVARMSETSVRNVPLLPHSYAHGQFGTRTKGLAWPVRTYTHSLRCGHQARTYTRTRAPDTQTHTPSARALTHCLASGASAQRAASCAPLISSVLLLLILLRFLLLRPPKRTWLASVANVCLESTQAAICIGADFLCASASAAMTFWERSLQRDLRTAHGAVPSPPCTISSE